ncbi:MAG TPA: GWxTD domain-containing protein [Candidatus Kapabacteria bacterium]|nr:GWxTD domain-containing protein [Candidatus Kapabacteria bacterium]
MANGQGFTSLDAVAYDRSNDSVQLEVYYSILQKLLPFVKNGATWTAPISGTIEIYQNDKIIVRQDIHKEKTFTGSEDDLKKHIADDVLGGAYFSIAAKPNTDAVLILTNLTDSQHPFNDTIHRRVEMPAAEKSKYHFGNIEFASNIQKTDDKSNFFEKVGFIVTPNASNTYGGNFTKLYYYTELCVPVSVRSASNAGELRLRIIDGEDHEVFKSSQTLSLETDIVPVIGSAEIDGLPTNSYILELTLVRNGVTEAAVRRTFYYDSGIELSDEAPQQTNAANIDENALYLTSDFSTMTEVELEDRSTQSLYQGTELQRKGYKKLTDIDTKRRWLFDFWRAKDKEIVHGQPLSTYRAMLKLVDEANKQFTVMKIPGWKTSRGRVLIQYGHPDQFDDHRFEINTKPYIIWEYVNLKIPIQSGSRPQFVFLDRQGGGNFVLVHSNVRTEVQENDWYTSEALRTTGY